MKCQLLLMLTNSIIASACLGQNSFDNAAPPVVVPPSPAAAALFHDIDIPVDYYTGCINTTIPIFEVKLGPLKVPISLHYKAGGVKVEEEAGWTGLSWDLQAGGAIGRTIVGRPDENSLSAPGGGGYRTGAVSLGMPNPMDELGTDVWFSNLGNCNLQKIALGKVLELTPDNYFINLCGNSARLFFDYNSKPYISPYKAWKITGNEANGFTVVTDDGTTYVCQLAEYSNTSITTSSGDDNSVPIMGNTSWLLTRIISSNKTDTVNFSYKPITYNPTFYIPQESQGVLWPGQSASCGATPPPAPHYYTYSSTTINGYVLSSIYTRNQRVDFISNANRSDIPDSTKGLPYKLDSIKIYAIGSGIPDLLLNKFAFTYDYFSDGGSGPADLRLRLLSVVNTDASGTLPQRYDFTYWGNYLPAKTSKGQDLYGYYNGKTNTTLIPTVANNGVIVQQLANRDIDSTLANTGMLKTIKYPTGGMTSFEYEQNREGKADSLSVPLSASVSTPYSKNVHTSYAEEYFTIAPISMGPSIQQVTVAVAINTEFPGMNGDVTVALYGDSGRTFIKSYSSNGVHDYTMYLGAGVYKITSSKQEGANESGSIEVRWLGHVAAPYVGNPVGGSRIKRMVQSDATTTKIKRFLYNLDDSTSSGNAMAPGVYGDFEYSPQYCGTAKAGDWRFYMQHSVSVTAVGGVKGGDIGYTKVTVLDGDNAEDGREEYYYTFAPDLGGGGYPYAPLTSADDEKGLLLTKMIYKQDGTLVMTEQNEYNFNDALGDPNFRHIYGVKAGQQQVSNTYNGNCPAGPGWSFSSRLYKMCQFWPVLSNTKNIIYSSNGNDSLSTYTYFNYDTTNGQVIRKAFLTSKSDTLYTYIKFSGTFTGTPVYDQMQNLNMVSVPVETDQFRNQAVVEKKMTNYALFPAGGKQLVLPSSVQLQTGNGPLETRLLLNKYDSWGNLQSVNKINDVQKVYLYDYQHVYPVAEIINADSASVAYTSFEADGNGGIYLNNGVAGIVSTDGITGTKCYVIDNALARFNLDPSKTYIVSLWAKNGTPRNNGFNGSTQVIADNTTWTAGKTVRGWTYLEKRFSGVTTINVGGGGGLVDEVRFYPANAQMTTYTYQPLVGMTSQCDAASRITYYEYDGLQRLLRIRDMDGNIVKQFQYQYQAAYNQ